MISGKRPRFSLKKKLHISKLENKEQEQLDLQIELEEEKIQDLKQEIDEQLHNPNSPFSKINTGPSGKAKLKQLEQLEKKKKELKNHNNTLADNIESLEDKKEGLEEELKNLNNQILEKVNLKRELKEKEISERAKEFQIKDSLYEKKRTMDNLKDDVTTK